MNESEFKISVPVKVADDVSVIHAATGVGGILDLQ
jgi:hypothetical protein